MPDTYTPTRLDQAIFQAPFIVIAHDNTAHSITHTLDDAVDMIFTGEITNGPAVAGLLAAARLRDRGYPATRPIDSPLPPRRF